MSLNRYKFEDLIHILVFLLALGVRLLNLGAIPLSESEATWALQALEVANRNLQLAPGPQTGYIALTGGIFALLGSTNFMARLLPALAGALMVLTPYLFRRKLGPYAAILCALGLALDPGLVSASRLAGGPIAAVAFALLAIGLAYNGRSLAAGVFAGLALISGPALLHGLLGAGIAWGAAWLLARAGWFAPVSEDGDDVSGFDALNLRQAALTALGTALVSGTLLGRFPQGLGAWMGALPAYLQGWALPSGVPGLKLVWLLLIYQPLALIFGLLGVVRAWRDARRDLQALAVWLLASLVIVLSYPNRQASDLIWVLVPLWGLAAVELGSLLNERVEPQWISLTLAGAVIVLMALFGLSLAGVGQVGLVLEGAPLRLGVLIGTLALQVVMVVLVGLGWDWRAARWGLVLGMSVSLGLYSLAGMWGSTQNGFSTRQELWWQTPAAGDADLLLKTLDDLSIWHTGQSDAIDIVVAVDSPSLRWLLRNFTNVRYLPESQSLSLADSPAVVISLQSDQQPALASSYRGQDFAWDIYAGWDGSLPPDPLRWLALRQAPLLQEQVIVWARGDIFPGGAIISTENQRAPLEVDPALMDQP